MCYLRLTNLVDDWKKAEECFLDQNLGSKLTHSVCCCTFQPHPELEKKQGKNVRLNFKIVTIAGTTCFKVISGKNEKKNYFNDDIWFS